MQHGGNAYLPHPGGGGRITTGNNEVLPISMREPYADDGVEAKPPAGGGGRSSGEEVGGKKPRRRGSLGRTKQTNHRRDVLERADLAFPNNEHLIPISTFATEQGMVLKKGKGGNGISSEGLRGMQVRLREERSDELRRRD